ncbi:MAG: hypothetical protein A4E52_02204 [Pelotomaculum sp. PtaB.Bin013]|uniref:PAS domain-containing protein n=1 Tax=Pelotomaculum isophthalicicum JI TaxID=947010 RepID=A0A9X4JWP7_9FIRM|nr:PAS domain-containing protein [Pelotomaculum isophthalicicum]MDF9409613.1 PAS domain-containing protein [Pelotomaculum isophthalicicum JI]OPX81434.1 MAG: hypothetical protein A4E52_02204 [Pelotomaculum sp. PtaB.Bin013]
MNKEELVALLDSIVEPIVFVDTRHIIRYVNKSAKDKHAKKGYMNLVGSSIFQCHNERSNEIILDTFKMLQKGEDEKVIYMNSAKQRVFMRAVRDSDGKLIGYYERVEKD